MINEPYAAGIVLYKPDMKRLKENLDAIAPQAHHVYCFNNGLGNDQRTARELLGSYDNVTILGDGHNIGIASALNALVRQAHDDGMTWILTLDQDSVGVVSFSWTVIRGGNGHGGVQQRAASVCG